jgi:hypothetical protein
VLDGGLGDRTVAESAKTPIPEFTAPVAEPAVKHEDFPEAPKAGIIETYLNGQKRLTVTGLLCRLHGRNNVRLGRLSLFWPFK